MAGLALFVWCFHPHLQAMLTFAAVVVLGVYIFLEPVTWLERGLWGLLLRCPKGRGGTRPILEPFWEASSPVPLWLRGGVIVLVYGTLTLGGLFLITSLGPTIAIQLAQIGRTLPTDLIHAGSALLHQVEQWIGAPLIPLEASPLLLKREILLDQWLTHQATRWTTQWLTAHPLTPQSLPQLMQQSFSNLGPWVATVSQGLVWSLLAIMAVFYSLLHAPQWQLTQRVPFLLDAHKVMRGFIRGQVLLGAITGTYMFIVYSLFGVKYALVMAILFGVVEILPVIGTWLGIIPGLAIAFMSGGFWTAVGVFACSYAYQTIKDNIVAPKIVGDVMGLHPVVVMASILLWGKIAGVLGVVMAIPLTALGWILWQHFLNLPSKRASLTSNGTASAVSFPSALVVKTGVVLAIFWLLANTLPEVLVLGSVVWLLTMGLGWLIESVEQTFSSLFKGSFHGLRLVFPSIPAVLPTFIEPTEATHLWSWRLRRIIATALVLSSIGFMGITLLLHWVPLVSVQWGRLLDGLPQLINTLKATLPFQTPLLNLLPPTHSLHPHVSSPSALLHWLTPLWRPATGVASLLVSTSLATTLWLLLGSVFLMYGLMDAAALRQGWLRLFPNPATFMPLWESIEHRMRLAVPAQWVWAGTSGLASYVLLEITHVSLSEGLATLFALGYLLPTVGPWFGSIPILLTTSAQGTWVGLFIWLSLAWALSTLKRRYWLPAWEYYAERPSAPSSVNNNDSIPLPSTITLSPLWWVAGSALCLEALGPIGVLVIIPFTVILTTLAESFIPASSANTTPVA
ncbi:MAG: AI-2E family transporter [Vampirovibrionales bacterium]|nr:AI-2E family transporter [Vampirovibrionales bacterium]